MTFSFKEQLKVGDAGEKFFLENYHSPIVKMDGRKADFRRISDGAIIELKTDTYSMEKTPNFFIERYSDFAKKSPGSIWQSKEKRVSVFCYLFIKDGVYFEFDLKKLVKELTPIAEDIEAKNKFLWIKNTSWVTAGFTYPRESLRHLFVEHRLADAAAGSDGDSSTRPGPTRSGS